MTDRRTDGQTDGQTDGGDCNIPDAFLKKRGDNYQQNHFSNIQGSYQPTPSLTKFHCPFNTLRKVKETHVNFFSMLANKLYNLSMKMNGEFVV